MKVVVLSRVAHPLHGYGGLERHVGAMVRHLAAVGLEVTLYTSPPEGDERTIPGVEVVGVRYRTLPWPRRAGFVIADRNTNYLLWNLRAGRAARLEKADVVHAEAAAGFGYAWNRRTGDAPLVLQAQGMEEFKTGLLKRAAYLPLRLATRFAARRSDRVIVPDRIMEEEVRHFLGVPPSRVVVLPLAIDLDEVDRRTKSPPADSFFPALDIQPSTQLTLSVGRLESNKGFSYLVKALERVKSELPAPWLWVIVGTGPEEGSLRRLVRDLGLSKNVRFAGRLSDGELSSLYGRAQLFVHPTLYEGSSLVTLEAMAHRRAVVASRVGGIPDKVVEGKSGFLVPPGDVEALGRAVVRAFSLGPRLLDLGVEGRRRVEAHFNWNHRAAMLIEVYREAMTRDGRLLEG